MKSVEGALFIFTAAKGVQNDSDQGPPEAYLSHVWLLAGQPPTVQATACLPEGESAAQRSTTVDLFAAG